MVVSRVKEAARRIVRPHLRCVTGEAQDFLAEMFFAIVVADTQMAFLTGTADDQLAQERGRRITRHLATLTNLSGEPNCTRAKTGLFSPSKTAPSVRNGLAWRSTTALVVSESSGTHREDGSRNFALNRKNTRPTSSN